MSFTLISVIVPVINSEDTIKGCIDSLINQSYPKKNYEIIVVDNGSSDNTLKIIKSYMKDIVLLYEEKKGSYAARNKGIKLSKGEIIVFTDSDCIVGRDWLFYIAKAFEKKKIKLIGGRIKAREKSNILLRYYDRWGHPQKEFFRSSHPFFATANMAIRKDKPDSLSLFNESLRSAGDVEFCLRFIKDRSEIYYESRAIVEHQYINSIIAFIKKNYYYGKWFKHLLYQYSFDKILPNYRSIFKSYGLNFLFLRILQDISFKAGIYLGKTKNTSFLLTKNNFNKES